MSIIYIRGIPDELKNQFKAHCAKRGRTMRKAIIQFMKDTIEAKDKKKC